MRKRSSLSRFLLLSQVMATLTGHAHVRTFPEAEGWAAVTQAGRGGQVITVTNLDADGDGSLKAALETEGPKTIVFNVGGVLDLAGTTLLIDSPFVTVAGQTAPYPGITIIDGGIEIRGTHDVLIQHIRVRPGAARHAEEVGIWEPDGITVNVSRNVIVDHCSLSWAVDENLTATGPRFEGADAEEWRTNTSSQVTFSNNIVAEALSVATHAEGEHSKGTLVHDNTSEIAIVKNFYSQNTARNPIFKAGSRGVILNNVVYNPGTVAMHFSSVASEWTDALATTGTPPEAHISVVSNRLHWGPLNTPESPVPLFVAIDEFAAIPELAGMVFLKLFFEDNLRFDHTGSVNPLIPELTDPFGEPAPQYIVEERPIWHTTFEPLSADELEDYILENVGARPWEPDPVDDRILADWQNRSGSIINFETEVGGFPELPSTARGVNWDTDGDGMPNSWELLRGLNPDVPDDDGFDIDPHFDPGDGTGYTNLEIYLHELGDLRAATEPKLEIASDAGSYELIWNAIPPDGQLEQSNNMKDWEVLAEGSVSGKQAFSIDEQAGRIFLRWSKNEY